MTYREWCYHLENFYDTLPAWFWNREERIRRYNLTYGGEDRKDEDVG